MTPQVGDHVLMLRATTTWIVLGEIRNTKQIPDRDLAAPQRLLSDATFTDGTKTAITGGYAVVGQSNGRVGTGATGTNIVLHSLGLTRRLKIHVAHATTNASGEATIVLPSTADTIDGQPAVFPGGAPLSTSQGYVLGFSATTTSVSLKLRQLDGNNASGVLVAVIIHYIGVV